MSNIFYIFLSFDKPITPSAYINFIPESFNVNNISIYDLILVYGNPT